MQLKPSKEIIVRSRRLSDQIYDLLLHRLRSGQISLDDVLTEPSVAEELNTSRTPAREALFRLASNQLLIEEGRGYRLPTLSQEKITELVAARVLLEVELVRLAAKRINNKDIAQLRAIAGLEATEVNGDAAAFITRNSEFREALFSLGNNQCLSELAALLNDRMQAYRVITLSKQENRSVVSSAHERLINALEASDANTAISVYESMMQLALAAYAD